MGSTERQEFEGENVFWKRISTQNLQEKMASSKDDAMKKFWQLPELVEKLLMFLDVKYVLNLAHAPTIEN